MQKPAQERKVHITLEQFCGLKVSIQHRTAQRQIIHRIPLPMACKQKQSGVGISIERIAGALARTAEWNASAMARHQNDDAGERTHGYADKSIRLPFP